MTAFWLTDPCPAWCEFVRNHSDRDDYDDRVHQGVARRVVATTEDLDRDTVDGQVHLDREPPDLTVQVVQHYREQEPRLSLHRGETRKGAYLTLDEAEELAAILGDLVKEARG